MDTIITILGIFTLYWLCAQFGKWLGKYLRTQRDARRVNTYRNQFRNTRRVTHVK